jgi:hypothetical protein
MNEVNSVHGNKEWIEKIKHRGSLQCLAPLEYRCM